MYLHLKTINKIVHENPDMLKIRDHEGPSL